MSTNQYHHHHDSQLFLVRVWPDRRNDGELEWQGKLQHVVSGETHTFNDWRMLIDLLVEMAKTDGVEVEAPEGVSEEASQ